jgi:ElaA protein
VIEQACLYQDLDGLDLDCIHMQCLRGEELVAYQRCLPPGLYYPQSSLGRIAVAPAARGQKLGAELVQRGIQFNLARWPDSGITIAAQAYLREFYTDLGFAAEGPEYLEDGIAHLKMTYCG